MIRKKANRSVELPQVNPRNVKKALELLWQGKPSQAFSPDWLGDQGISQPNQTWSLLQFLGLLDESDRPSETTFAYRGNRTKFIEHVVASAINAYGKEGLGSPSSLAWLGRDTLSRKEFRDRVAGKGRFDVHRLKNGGCKNAFYCLRSLHELLVDGQWLRDPAESATDERPRSLAREGTSLEQNDSAVSQDDLQEGQMIERRLSDSDEIRDLLRGLLDDRPIREDTHGDDCIRVPVGSDDNGKTVWARVYFDGPERPRYIAELARLLQSMAEGMQR